MKTDKVWKFYYKGDISKSDILHPSNMTSGDWEELDKYDNPKVKGKYPLYAFTNVKRYAKGFRHQRDMNKFIMIKSNISDVEYSYLMDNYQDLLLGDYLLETKCYNERDEESLDSVEVICSHFEYLSATEHDMLMLENERFWENSIPIHCFEGKVREALKILEYDSLRKIYFETRDGVMDDEFEYPDLGNDELAIFIQCFQETLKQ